MKKQLISTMLLSTLALNPAIAFGEEVIIGSDAGSSVVAIDSTVETDTVEIVVGSSEEPTSEEQPKVNTEVVVGADETKPSVDETVETEKPAGEVETVAEDKEITFDEIQTETGLTIIPISNPTPVEELIFDEPAPVTIENFETPVISETGYEIVGTEEGDVLVMTETGEVETKTAESIGAVKQEDGTIALKDNEGKLQVLPSTGEKSEAIQKGLGVLLLTGIGAYIFRDKLKSLIKKTDKKS